MTSSFAPPVSRAVRSSTANSMAGTRPRSSSTDGRKSRLNRRTDFKGAACKRQQFIDLARHIGVLGFSQALDPRTVCTSSCAVSSCSSRAMRRRSSSCACVT